MSGVKRYVVTGTTPSEARPGERSYFTAEVVLASDYDRDVSALRQQLALALKVPSVAAMHSYLDTECAKQNVQLADERDTLRAQVEAMRKEAEAVRDLLRKVAPHFAAPPGMGYLHSWIDAAIEEPKP